MAIEKQELSILENGILVEQPKLHLPFSEQSQIMIKNLNKFDEKDFAKWFISKLSIGSSNILQYLIDKEAENGIK
jgi:hypothetical protein